MFIFKGVIEMKKLILFSLLMFCFHGSIFAAPSWEVFYDGSDLLKCETEGNWLIQKDGSLMLQPREGESGWKRYKSYLWLKGDFKDFECEFEYKHKTKGNSGFYFRVSDTADAVKTGVELQLLDCMGKEKVGFHDLGGIIKFKDKAKGAPLVNASKPAGEWNKVRVKIVNNKLTAYINGKLVQDKNDLVANKVDGGLNEVGRLGFQDHGENFWLRNIKVKKL